MKNICFIANYYKTDVFVEVAKLLAKKQITTFWIVPNKNQYNALQEYFEEHQLLYIGKKEVLASQNKDVGIDLKINELIYGDRVLKHESKTWSFKYLSKLTNMYYNFIKTNVISFVFGEVTWAHELLAHRLTLKTPALNCQFLNPHTIRIPNGRFTFFTDEFQSQIKEFKNKVITTTDSITLEKPAYLALNDKFIAKKGTLRHNITLIKNFFLRTNQDANDPTLYSNPITQLKVRSTEVYNRFIFNKFIKEIAITHLPKNKKKVLFTLHKQPEASIDVIGRYYENQLTLITNIWRLLPQNYILIIKEHSNAIGDRSLQFYKAIRRLKNTYLVTNKADSHKLLDICNVVFTVSGTIAYEAALKQKTSFTFAPAFFNKMTNCNEVSWKDFKNNTLEDLVREQNNGLSIKEFSKWLLDNSFEGIMSDAFGDPSCMQQKNINKLYNGFLNIIEC